MNECKVRRIMEWIRSQGKLPTNAYGQILSVNDLMGWFGLTEFLTKGEQIYMYKELSDMIEAELSLEKLRESEKLRQGMS